MNNHRALILDDEPDIRELLGLTLSRMGIDYKEAGSLKEAYQLLNDYSFDLCLTDMRLPDGEGIELVQFIQKRHPSLPVAVITAYGNTQLAIDSLKAGAFDFISKPVDLEKLRELITNAIRLDIKSEDEPRADDILLGESRPMQLVREMIHKLARSQAPVLISGESGTGKELVARQIHLSGPRCDKPFIAVNCGAIPAELMESEFFGHKKGSFTGATHDKEGLFQAAHEGTLFLDEVAELPLHMQVKLLRVIQERAIRPVGEHKERHVDVRILSASNQDLEAMVEKSDFRHDLYFRLNVIGLELPPLRARREDISQLASHILDNLQDSSRPRLQISYDALTVLKQHAFPGNIRELENILERAATLCEGTVIEPGDLMLSATSATVSDQPDTNVPENGLSYPVRGETPLEEHLAKIERHEIKAALEKTLWNRVKAAELLGMSPRQLRYKITKFDLEK